MLEFCSLIPFPNSLERAVIVVHGGPEYPIYRKGWWTSPAWVRVWALEIYEAVTFPMISKKMAGELEPRI